MRRDPLLWSEKPLEGIPRGYSLLSHPLDKWLGLIGSSLERAVLRPWCRRISIDRPIFIIGAFRSGTSILEHIIAQHPDVGHFWFLTNVCYRAPVICYWLAHLAQALGLLERERIPFIHNPRIKFTVFSPYECEWVWSQSKKNLWDGHCTDLTAGADFSDPRFERYLLDLIQRHLWIQRATRFMNKNPVHCLRMEYLHKLFPDARFIHLVRDPLATVISHYRTAARMQRVIYSDARVKRIFQERLRVDVLTMRIKTRNYALTLALDRIHPLLGIAHQWKELQAAVLESLARRPSLAAQVLRVRYEDMVSQPIPVLESIWDFIELRDERAEAITRAYAPRLSPPPPYEPTAEERRFLPRVRAIVAPVAARLGYSP